MYFNQATMYHGAETGHDTLAEAEDAGHSGFVGSEKAELSFGKHLYA